MGARKRLLAVLGLVVVVIACGDNGQTRATAPTSAASVTTTTMSTVHLGAMLLDASDVGAGWQVGSDVNEADFADAARSPCGAAMDPSLTQRLTPVAGVQFEPTDRSYKHLIEFAVTGDPTQLDSDLQAFWNAVESCPTSTSQAGTLTVETFAIPALGDQRIAFTLTGRESTDTTATWHGRSAAVRVGPTAIELGLTEILSAPQETPSISDAEFVKLLQAAVAKLAG